MYYMGSKDRHAEEILSVVLDGRRPWQTYVEPFVGGANVIKYVPQHQGPRIGADVNEYMVALHAALAGGWEPPSAFTAAEYKAMKKRPRDYPPELVGFIMTGCSFGAKWMGGWAANAKGTNYCAQARASCLRDAPGLKGATFVHSSYDKLEIPPESLVYCDPPYASTTAYVGDNHINRWKIAPFWRWADAMVDAGHQVFVSEYTGPPADAMVAKNPAREQALAHARAAYRLAQGSDAIGSAPPDAAAMEVAHENIKALEAEDAAARLELTKRWKVVWSKEVKANFDAGRTDDDEANGRVEMLFHREP